MTFDKRSSGHINGFLGNTGGLEGTLSLADDELQSMRY